MSAPGAAIGAAGPGHGESAGQGADHRRLEWEVALLVLLIVGVYFVRLTDLGVRGEESRWGHIVQEMLRRGDWLVLRQQGEPFLTRPPLGCWLIGLVTLIRGDCDLLALRLPTVLATLLTTLLVHRYARTFLARPGALVAGVAYATFAQVLELGRLAETESLFTLLVSGSLLVWHAGFSRGWRGAWVAGYFLAGLAALAKGPQAPLYFTAAVGMYLLLRGRWRELLTVRHLLGLATFFVVVGSWQVPFVCALGWPAVRSVWGSDVGLRFQDTSWQTIVLHLLRYPLEVFGCTLPWSPVLLGYLSRRLRAALAGGADPAFFLWTCVLVTFPTCWLPPGAQSRYFMPLYPCLAILIGLAVQRGLEAPAGCLLEKGLRAFLGSGAVGMAGAAALVALAARGNGHLPRLFHQSAGFTVFYVAAGSVLAVLAARGAWRSRAREARYSACLPGLLALPVFVGLSMTGLVLNDHIRKSVDSAPQVAWVKTFVPPGRSLVSFGPLHSLFLYSYRDAVEQRPWPVWGRDDGEGIDYFCFDRYGHEWPLLPFAWEVVGVVNCDRYVAEETMCVVVVGRRVPGTPGSSVLWPWGGARSSQRPATESRRRMGAYNEGGTASRHAVIGRQRRCGHSAGAYEVEVFFPATRVRVVKKDVRPGQRLVVRESD
jgi:4-amino-4-deoxy-L-arabinose transferase-like glycosyltransferase